MKHFMIKYQFANGTPEEWHREIGRFIAALDNDPELKGKIILPLHEKPRRFQLLASRLGCRRFGGHCSADSRSRSGNLHLQYARERVPG